MSAVAAATGEEPAWEEWINTNIRDGHAMDRKEHEALQELYNGAMSILCMQPSESDSIG